jgi:hypothetical protein
MARHIDARNRIRDDPYIYTSSTYVKRGPRHGKIPARCCVRRRSPQCPDQIRPLTAIASRESDSSPTTTFQRPTDRSEASLSCRRVVREEAERDRPPSAGDELMTDRSLGPQPLHRQTGRSARPQNSKSKQQWQARGQKGSRTARASLQVKVTCSRTRSPNSLFGAARRGAAVQCLPVTFCGFALVRGATASCASCVLRPATPVCVPRALLHCSSVSRVRYMCVCACM